MRLPVRTASVFAIVFAIVWFCGGTLVPERGRGDATRVVVYGFSILAEAFREDLFPLFRARWGEETGREVEFLDSFNASGVVANQIVYGAPADIAIFSHPGDADRLLKAGRAARDWRDGPNRGIVNRTPIVIAVRPGNPKKIEGFRCLGRSGVRVVHPDPLTSGGAQWAILAEYGDPIVRARAAGREPDPEAAVAQLAGIWRNVTARAPSARAARTQFDQGFGDALVTYEAEVLLDATRGDPVQVVAPGATILCEHPAVLVDRNVGDGERPAVEAFFRFLFGEEAQRVFVKHGFRSILPGLDAENPRLHRVAHPFAAGDLGGWDRARAEIVERVWMGRVLVEASPR